MNNLRTIQKCYSIHLASAFELSYILIQKYYKPENILLYVLSTVNNGKKHFKIFFYIYAHIYPSQCFSFLPEAVDWYLGHFSFSLKFFSSYFCSADLLVIILSVFHCLKMYLISAFISEGYFHWLEHFKLIVPFFFQHIQDVVALFLMRSQL